MLSIRYNNGYHAHEVNKPRDISNNVLKQMERDGKIPKAQVNKLRKGKSKKRWKKVLLILD